MICVGILSISMVDGSGVLLFGIYRFILLIGWVICLYIILGMVFILIGCVFCVLWNLLMLLYVCFNVCFIVFDKCVVVVFIFLWDMCSEVGFIWLNFLVNLNSVVLFLLCIFVIICVIVVVMFVFLVIVGCFKIDFCWVLFNDC